jgi:Ca-activated chloride channel family protein
MDVEVDEALLQEISRRTGARFFRATDARALAEVFLEIDRLEKTPLAVKRYVRYREAFAPFAWTALAFTLLPLAAAASRLTAEP